ncbi:MAG: peptidoglycan bridge formation glycyltransferase FemA/FemB family protein [bacterium]
MISIFQTHEWEQLKLKTGYQNSHWIDDILVLQKQLPLRYSMLYMPMVALDQLAKEISADKPTGLMEKILELSKETNSIFCRLEIDGTIEKLANVDLLLKRKNIVKSFEEMQPEHTLILDISNNKSEILAQMKQKGRYNIKIAEKNKVFIEQSSAKGELLDNFYALYRLTGSRHGITSRNSKYFEALLDILGKKGYARVYNAFAMIEGKKTPLAAAIMLFYKERLTYLYGGSSNEHRGHMAPYLLHSTAIDDAKAQNCTSYDFFGIAPNDDSKHPWSGVTRFKKQFGGEQVDLIGSYDIIFKPVEYQLFKIAEKLRRS